MRQAQQQASQGITQANATANQYGGQAGNIGANLIPGLEREAATPQGFTPEQQNDMLVASEQGAGGANAGITGAAGLQAARSRNSAGMSNVLDEAARDKTRALSGGALDIQNRSAELGQQKQMAAQQTLGNLYGTDVNAQLKAQGLIPEDINAEVAAGQSGWYQNLLGGMNTAANVANSVANVMAACPAEGSMYLMADGTEKPVQDLQIGDQLKGIDGEPQTIEEINTHPLPILIIGISDGFVVRNSQSHTFQGPNQRVIIAEDSLGKMVYTANGRGPVISIMDGGVAPIFDVRTDGGHTYRADGVWAIGVGDAEGDLASKLLVERLMSYAANY